MTTTKHLLVCCALVFLSPLVSLAQDKPDSKKEKEEKTVPAEKSPTPRNMPELGVHVGHLFVAGDVTYQPGFGYGLSLRKALDYPFSIRLDVMRGSGKGESPQAVRSFELDYLAGTVFGVLSLNNMRWDKPTRPTNLYGMVGAGGSYYRTEFVNEFVRKDGVIEREPAIHAALGAGLSIRINSRFNIGLEHQAHVMFGQRSDNIDGTEKFFTGEFTQFRDIINYSAIKFNFNIGNQQAKSEPLYWLNPLDYVLNDLDAVKKKTEGMGTDSDGDGIMDLFDQEPNTPTDAIVDVKGRTLDSDRDGVADHLDKEPYYTPRQGETIDENGVVTNPVAGGVSEDRVKELIDEALDRRFGQAGTPGGAPGSGGYGGTGAPVAELFLPMIHFNTDSYAIKYSDYGALAGVARLLKGNPNVRLVVVGFTDQVASEEYNNKLSYTRALEVVNHLVNTHGIARGRLIINWKGKENPLVPRTSSYMNRRVEFRTASASDVEQDPPAGGN